MEVRTYRLCEEHGWFYRMVDGFAACAFCYSRSLRRSEAALGGADLPGRRELQALMTTGHAYTDDLDESRPTE